MGGVRNFFKTLLVFGASYALPKLVASYFGAYDPSMDAYHFGAVMTASAYLGGVDWFKPKKDGVEQDLEAQFPTYIDTHIKERLNIKNK